MKNVLFLAVGMAVAGVASSAQVPPNIEAELKKIGQIVDPACTESYIAR